MCRKLVYSLSLILLMSLVGTSTAQNVDPSLVGWWTFEDGFGSVARDVSGKSVDAEITGAVSWGQDKQYGGILLFNGTLDAWEYVFIDGDFNVPLYTITMWLRVDGGEGTQRDVFSAYAPGVVHGILLEVQTGGTLRYLHRYPLGTGGGTNIYTTTSYDDGQWYHVAMLKAEGQIRLYIDGEEVGSAVDNSVFNPGDTFGIALGILDHERAGTDKRLLPGAIDDVRIYDRPLSQEEIQAIVETEPWPYAWGPSPADGVLYADTWVTLGWTPGAFAVSHDMYLGDNSDEVNEGTGDTFRGNQTDVFYIAGFPGFAFPDGLIPGTTYYWRIDEVNDLHPDSPWKGDVWSFTVPSKKAYKPDPAVGAKFIDTNVALSWTAGFGSRLHYVYFGDNFEDVSNAAGGASQTITTYTAGPLEPGKNYYWRVDEFDGATTHTGDVWSFTTSVTGGGLRAEYFMGTDLSNHVLTRIDPQINFNWPVDTVPDDAVGSGAYSVRWTGEIEAAYTETYIFYTNSADGVRLWVDGRKLVDNWTDHTNTENSGRIDLVAGNVYSLQMDYYENGDGAVAELLWSSPSTPEQIVPQAALSPPIKASSPRPANRATGTKLTPILDWNSGDYAALHEVYFGTDADAVKNATKTSPEYKGDKATGDEIYDPGKLAWHTTYYWRIDEVNSLNPDSPWIGNLWSFTTGDFLLIDNFEDYDADENQIWYSWHDGLGYGAPGTDPYFAGNGTGAAVGDENTASYTEETIVHDGSKSIPLAYDNNKQGFSKYSETELILTAPRDWTEEGVTELSLWFRGYPASVGSFVEGPAGTYTITGSGTDIWGNADEFHFAYKILTGVGSIVAKVESVDNTNNWAKAGVMIRETLDPGSVHATMVVTPAQGISFQRRTSTDNTSSDTTTGEIVAPYWVKIERDFAGNFTASSSTNGSTWEMQGTWENIQMGSSAYIGLAVTSHDATLACQAVFTNVTITGTVGSQWANQDIGIVSNAAEPLYVAVSNSTGTPAVVVHDDPAASQIDTWTEWVIPLQALADQGIVLTNVDRIALGLGTKGNMTVPGGSGKMYFDDIRLYRPRDIAAE
ncbi:LamG-like jellyroll fold domain-containing protein [Planctomycetota bacterium]